MSDTKISEAVAWCSTCPNSGRQEVTNNHNTLGAWHRAGREITSLHPQPAELAEQQGDAPEIEQLGKLVSSILSTVSLGHQTGPHAYAGEDFGRYLREATSDCRTILRMLPTLAATGKQQVGEKCLTCSDRGWVGGPTFSDPAEGGMQCPDCNALDAHMERYEQQVGEVQGSND